MYKSKRSLAREYLETAFFPTGGLKVGKSRPGLEQGTMGVVVLRGNKGYSESARSILGIVVSAPESALRRRKSTGTSVPENSYITKGENPVGDPPRPWLPTAWRTNDYAP